MAQRVVMDYGFGGKIYLVGSALTSPTPRDIDLRLVLLADDFAKRYGPVKEWLAQGHTGQWGDGRWRSAKESVEWTRRMCEYLELNIDFQIYPEGHLRGNRFFVFERVES